MYERDRQTDGQTDREIMHELDINVILFMRNIFS